MSSNESLRNGAKISLHAISDKTTRVTKDQLGMRGTLYHIVPYFRIFPRKKRRAKFSLLIVAVLFAIRIYSNSVHCLPKFSLTCQNFNFLWYSL